MEILDKFGFNPVLFGAQIVNFLILFIIFKKFLYKPILKTLKDREKKIAQGLTDAEKAQHALEQAEAEREKILGTASKEAQVILEETKKQAEEVRAKLLDQSKKDADRMIADAKAQAASEMDKMRKEANGLSLSLSQKILDSVLKKLFTKEDQEKLMKRGAEELKKHE